MPLEVLFDYFRLEDQVPETTCCGYRQAHQLRVCAAATERQLQRNRTAVDRSRTSAAHAVDRVSVRHPSERKLVEELRMHLAWRWFTGLGFDQEIPHHSTFSKNRHGRFQESKLFEQLFERSCGSVWKWDWCKGRYLSVDGSFVEANAAKESRIPREQLGGSGPSSSHRASVSARSGRAESGGRAGA